MNVNDKEVDSYDYVEDVSNISGSNSNSGGSINSMNSSINSMNSSINGLTTSIDHISLSDSNNSIGSNSSSNSSGNSNSNGINNNNNIKNSTTTATTATNISSTASNGLVPSPNHHNNHHNSHNGNSNHHSPKNKSNQNNNNTASDDNYYSMAKMYLNNRPNNSSHGLGRVNFNMKSEDLDQQWFHKEATREVSLALLTNKPIGSFLIRPSSQIGSYAMSWVKNDNGEIGHNLIYGLCPGYSLKQNPTATMERYWSLQKLVEGCDYLKGAVKVSSSTTAIAKSKNAKTSTEVLGRIVERVSANDPTVTELLWTLYIIGENESSSKSSEKGTYVKYADEEYTAPEILPLSGGSMNLIALALQTNTHTHSIFINGYESYLRMSFQPNIGDAEAQSIATILTTNKSLTLLNLSLNDFTDKGAKIISDALKTNTTLKFLSLSHNFIGKEGLIALTDAIRVNKTLDFIDISGQLVKRRNIINLVHSDVERTLMTLLEDTMKRKCELFGMYEIRSDSDISNINNLPMSIGMNSQQQKQQQQNINFSVSLQKLPYFHGFLTKQSAEKRLNAVGTTHGSFLFYLNYYIPNSIFLAIQVQKSDPTSPSGFKYDIIHKMIHRVHFGYRFVSGDQDNLRDEILEEEALYNFQINNKNHDNTVTHTNSYNYSYRYRPIRKGCGAVIPTLFEFCSWILASHPQYKEIYEQLYNINSIIGDRFQDIHDLVPLWGSRDVKPVVALSNAKHNISRKGVYPTLSQLYKLNKGKLTNPVTREQYQLYRLHSKIKEKSMSTSQ